VTLNKYQFSAGPMPTSPSRVQVKARMFGRSDHVAETDFRFNPGTKEAAGAETWVAPEHRGQHLSQQMYEHARKTAAPDAQFKFDDVSYLGYHAHKSLPKEWAHLSVTDKDLAEWDMSEKCTGHLSSSRGLAHDSYESCPIHEDDEE
jgi:hypothetical protein